MITDFHPSFFLADLGSNKLRTVCGVISFTVRMGNSLQVIKYCAFS